MLIIHSALVSWLARFFVFLPDVGRAGLLGLYSRLGRSLDVVPDRTDAKRIFARAQTVLWENVAALFVGDLVLV